MITKKQPTAVLPRVVLLLCVKGMFRSLVKIRVPTLMTMLGGAVGTRPVSKLVEMLVKVVVTLTTGRRFSVVQSRFVSGTRTRHLVLAVSESTTLRKISSSGRKVPGTCVLVVPTSVLSRFVRLVTLIVSAIMRTMLSMLPLKVS